MVIPDPTHSQEILYRQTRKVQLHHTANDSIRQASQQFLDWIAAPVTDNNPYAILKTSELQNIYSNLTWKFSNLYKFSSTAMKGPNTTPSGGSTDTVRVVYKIIDKMYYKSLEDNDRK